MTGARIMRAPTELKSTPDSESTFNFEVNIRFLREISHLDFKMDLEPFLSMKSIFNFKI